MNECRQCGDQRILGLNDEEMCVREIHIQVLETKIRKLKLERLMFKVKLSGNKWFGMAILSKDEKEYSVFSDRADKRNMLLESLMDRL